MFDERCTGGGAEKGEIFRDTFSERQISDIESSVIWRVLIKPIFISIYLIFYKFYI